MPAKQENGALADKGLASELKALADKAFSPNQMEWYLPWRVVPESGKPTIAGSHSGNLFRGFIGTWQDADLVVALVNNLPAILAVLSAQPAGDAIDAEIGRAHLAELIFNHIADIGSEPFVVVKDGDGWLTRTLAAHDVLRTHPPKPEAMAGEGDFAKTLARELREQSRYPSGAPRISLETAESIVREALSRTSQANEGEIERLREALAETYHELHACAPMMQGRVGFGDVARALGKARAALSSTDKGEGA